MSHQFTSHRCSADASMSTIRAKFTTNLYQLEALSLLAQAAITNDIAHDDECVIGVAVLFQDVIDVFQEIR
jgi:hypothetical protein